MSSINANALRSLDLICQAATSLNLKCEAEVQGNGVRLNFRDDLVIVARLNVRTPTIKFIATQFDAIPSRLVGDYCEFIAMLNTSLPIGYFALEAESREFRFYYDMSYEFGGDLQLAVCLSLQTIISNFRQVRPVAKMINDNMLSVERALNMLQRTGRRDDDETTLTEICKLIEGIKDERDVIDVQWEQKQIIVTKHDDIGTPIRKSTIRVDSISQTVSIMSVIPASGSNVAWLVRQTKLKFGSAKVDEGRRELIVFGTAWFGQRAQSQPVCELLKEHFQSMRCIYNADTCRA